MVLTDEQYDPIIDTLERARSEIAVMRSALPDHRSVWLREGEELLDAVVRVGTAITSLKRAKDMSRHRERWVLYEDEGGSTLAT